ncbi:MAG: M48 family metalloprotease [Pseudomonadota bacterium]
MTIARLNNKFLVALIGCLPLIGVQCAGVVAHAQTFELPSIGSPADALLPKTEEARIGRAMMRMFHDQGRIVQDPELTEYINDLGHTLVGHASTGDQEFEFFIVNDSSINAFALPGGYIGVHTGLLQLTRDEAELASVLAHEIAHVTQRHIARTIHDNSRQSLFTMAAMLGAIAVGAATNAGGEVLEGALATSQAVAAQNQINFTRGYEYEADRIGIATLANAGFDVDAMADFFARMGRKTNNSLIPGAQFEYLRTHPVSSSRTAEAKSRAARYPDFARPNSTGYELMKARTHALFLDTPERATAFFARDPEPQEKDTSLRAVRYGRALAAMRDNRPADAEALFEELIEKQHKVIPYHIGLALAQAANDQVVSSLETFERAQELFPRNVPLTIRHAEVLLETNQAAKAHELLLDLLNNVPPTPEQVRLIARAAIDAEQTAEAHYYMAEYNIMTGNLVQAVILLRRGANLSQTTPIQRARFLARADFVSDYLSEDQKLEVRRDRSARVSAG